MKTWVAAVLALILSGLAGYGLRGYVDASNLLRLQRSTDSTIAALRADSAALATQSATQSRQLDSLLAKSRHDAATLAGSRAELARVRERSKSAVASLDSAQTAVDSLRQYPMVVATLTAEIDSLRGGVVQRDSVIDRQNLVIVTLTQLRQTDSLRLHNAESRVTALGNLNQSLAKQLASERSRLWPKVKVSAGTALVGVAVLCLATTVC